jgi:hypothetical protein
VQTISLHVTNEDGCVSNNASMTLTVKALPQCLLSASSVGELTNDTVMICANKRLVLKSPL